MLWAGGRSSDSGLPPPPPSRPAASGVMAGEQLPSQRRDRPGITPGSLTVGPFRASLSWAVVPARRLSHWLPVVAWAALIFALSSVPSLSSGLGFWDLVLRKAAHVTEYAILGALLFRALERELPAFAIGLAYAVTDEIHQHFVHGRHASPVDVLIDAAGIAIGIAAYSAARGRLPAWAR
jgi:VanZ like protein